MGRAMRYIHFEVAGVIKSMNQVVAPESHHLIFQLSVKIRLAPEGSENKVELLSGVRPLVICLHSLATSFKGLNTLDQFMETVVHRGVASTAIKPGSMLIWHEKADGLLHLLQGA